jgi:poly(3-hydroxybutyrate) depolymerase
MPRTIPPLRETEDRPVSYAVHFWRKVNHCHRAVSSAYGAVEITDFDCFRSPLRLISLRNEGHTWPGATDGLIGAEKPRGQFSVGEAMWSFWQGTP